MVTRKKQTVLFITVFSYVLHLSSLVLGCYEKETPENTKMCSRNGTCKEGNYMRVDQICQCHDDQKCVFDNMDLSPAFMHVMFKCQDYHIKRNYTNKIYRTETFKSTKSEPSAKFCRLNGICRAGFNYKPNKRCECPSSQRCTFKYTFNTIIYSRAVYTCQYRGVRQLAHAVTFQ